MKNCSEYIGIKATFELPNIKYLLDLTITLVDDPVEQIDHRHEHLPGNLLWEPLLREEAGEKSGADHAFSETGKIDVSDIASLEKVALRITFGIKEIEQDVSVAVND
jgi:hypothetical protein